MFHCSMDICQILLNIGGWVIGFGIALFTLRFSTQADDRRHREDIESDRKKRSEDLELEAKRRKDDRDAEDQKRKEILEREEKNDQELRNKIILSILVELKEAYVFYLTNPQIYPGYDYYLNSISLDATTAEQIRLFKNYDLIKKLSEWKNEFKKNQHSVYALNAYPCNTQNQNVHIIKSHWRDILKHQNETKEIKELLIAEYSGTIPENLKVW
jgi:hypothetical protein